MGGKGSGGKNRKPTAMKVAEGNRGKREINKQEPVALPGEPPMPKDVTADVRAIWPEVCAMLNCNGTLFKTDGLAIATFCSNLVMFRKAEAAVAKYGAVAVELEEETGVAVMKLSALYRFRSDAEKKLRASYQEFGLNPSSRAGIAIPEPSDKPKNGLDSIRNAKNTKDEVVH
jgi:P27 family predicted phage terminase small subunit